MVEPCVQTLSALLRNERKYSFHRELKWHMPHMPTKKNVAYATSLLFTPLPGAATSALYSGTLLRAFQSQLAVVPAIILVLLAISYHLFSSAPPSPWTDYRQFSHFLSLMEVHAALLGQLSTIFSSAKSSKTSSCIHDCPTTLMQIFITEMSFWLGIALRNSLHLQEQFNSRKECPTSSQTNSRAG